MQINDILILVYNDFASIKKNAIKLTKILIKNQKASYICIFFKIQ